MRKCNPQKVVFDMCQHGANYRKRTTVYYAGPEMMLDPLNKQCTGTSNSHQHVTLSGWYGQNSSQMQPTKGSAAYPAELCSAWAECMCAHVM